MPVRAGPAAETLAWCYTIEALLYAYDFERDPVLLRAAKRGIEWMLGRQRADGSLPRWYGGGRFRGCAPDVQAQATRLFAVARRPNLTSWTAMLALQALALTGPEEDGGATGRVLF